MANKGGGGRGGDDAHEETPWTEEAEDEVHEHDPGRNARRFLSLTDKSLSGLAGRLCVTVPGRPLIASLKIYNSRSVGERSADYSISAFIGSEA